MAEPDAVDSLGPHTNTNVITHAFIHTMSILLAYTHMHTESQT